MVALPQLHELEALPHIPTPVFGEPFNKLLCDKLEYSLAVIDKTIVQGFDEFVSWLVNLVLEADRAPMLSKQQVAHYLNVIEMLFIYQSDFDHDIARWNQNVDEKGEWHGLGTLSKSQTRQIKRINFRFRKMSKRVRKMTSHQKKDLIAHLLVQVAKQRELSRDEKIRLLKTIPDHRPIDNPISMRRADWYGDDA